MDTRNPIYTEKTECQDCYKCLRSCPVKAIRVQNGSAAVIPEACLLCGHCTAVCPVGAKKVRNDLPMVRELLKNKPAVYASLAPTYRTEFAGIDPGVLVTALKKLGFAGVSETALGAQEVSAACARQLAESPNKVLISTACPAVVRLVERYFPHLVSHLTTLYSPLQAHVRLLRREFGDDAGVVFIGPCIAKKAEDPGPDASLTFVDLRNWLKEDGVLLELDGDKGEFVPQAAHEGGLYPIDGGMIKGIKRYPGLENVQFMSFSGVEEIMASFEDIEKAVAWGPVFVEALACKGGCVNGPGVSKKGATARKRGQVFASTPRDLAVGTSLNTEQITKHYQIHRGGGNQYTDEELTKALMRVGKKRAEDELNCGGCGYNYCREFATALLDGRAEPSMCVSYLRKLAQNKATAIIKAMPSGVVIVDADLRIIECNLHFVELIGGDAGTVYEVNPDLEGAYLERLIPFADLFAEAIAEGSEVKVHDLHHEGRIIRLTLFSVQPHQVVGGIMQDITEPEILREQIVQKAGEVMRKNLTTVQQIAFLLGENAADSEVLLNSIIESFNRRD